MSAATEIKSSKDFYNDFGQILSPHRAHWSMQLLLQLNCYLSLLWACSYLILMIIWWDQMWNYNGLIILLIYVVAVVAEWLRLYAGCSINLNTGSSTWWLVLAVMPCVILPSLVYLRFAALSGGNWLLILMSLQFGMMCAETIVTLILHICATESFNHDKATSSS